MDIRKCRKYQYDQERTAIHKRKADSRGKGAHTKLMHRGIKGYMTLEAAFMIPWVIFLFVFLIYASFYLYDKCVLFQDCYAVCFRGSVQKEENGALDYINSHMERQFGRKYFGVGSVEGAVEQEGKEVSVYGTCSVKIPFAHFITMANAHGWQIRTSAKAQMINPTKVIRRCRMVENVLQAGKKEM